MRFSIPAAPFATFALLGTSLVVAACGGGSGGDSSDSAAAAVDSSESTQAEGDMIMSSMSGASGTSSAAPTTGADLAVTIAANIAARWPGGCAVATASGSNVTVTYTDCTGPHGLVAATGEIDLALTVSLTGGISVHATATDFEINQATLTFDATADYSLDGTSDKLSVTSNGTGTGPRGNEIDHNGTYTIEWDPTTSCHSIDGSWSTDFSNAAGAKDRANTVSLDRCPSLCPTGTVTHKFLAGASVSITFDGTDVATWSASTGGTGTVELTCDPAN